MMLPEGCVIFAVLSLFFGNAFSGSRARITGLVLWENFLGFCLLLIGRAWRASAAGLRLPSWRSAYLVGKFRWERREVKRSNGLRRLLLGRS